MKKLLLIFLTVTILLSLFCSCAETDVKGNDGESDIKPVTSAETQPLDSEPVQSESTVSAGGQDEGLSETSADQAQTANSQNRQI